MGGSRPQAIVFVLLDQKQYILYSPHDEADFIFGPQPGTLFSNYPQEWVDEIITDAITHDSVEVLWNIWLRDLHIKKQVFASKPPKPGTRVHKWASERMMLTLSLEHTV